MNALVLAAMAIMLNVIHGSEFRGNVLRNLVNLCPGQYIQADIYSNYTVTNTEESCCIDSFNDSIRFRIPSNETSVKRPDQQCILPYLRRRSNNLFQERRSYYMVTEAPEGGCVASNSSMKTKTDILNHPTCNDSEIKVLLQRLLPVYSRSRNLIYKNPQCAQCHGIEDPDHWIVFVNCKHYEEFSTDTLSCDFDFLFPRQDKEIQHLECFTESFNQCPLDLSKLFIPNNFDLTIEELKNACFIENLPRYINNLFYAKNIFCFICHHNIVYTDLLEIQSCGQETETILQKSLNTNSFARILALRTMSKALTKTEFVCGIDVDKENCYPLLCPIGQLMVDEGEGRSCLMDSSLWIRPQFSLLLRLEFDKDIPIKGSLKETFTKNAFSGLKIKSWTLNNMYIPFVKYANVTNILEPDKSSPNGQTINSVKHIYAEMMFNELTIKPDEFMTNLKETLSGEKLYFTSSREKVGLRLKQSRVSLWSVEASVPNLQKDMTMFVTSDQIYEYAQPRDRILYKLITLIKKTKSDLFLTKLWFCPQVEIPTRSFYLLKYLDNIVAVYHNHTGITFFDREFLFQNQWQSIRICASDIKKNTSSGIKGLLPMIFWYHTVRLITAVFYQ